MPKQVEPRSLEKNSQLFLDVLGGFVDQETIRAGTLSRKAASLTGYGAVVLSLLLTSLNQLFKGSTNTWQQSALVLLALSVISIGFAVISALRQLAPLPFPEVDYAGINEFTDPNNLVEPVWERTFIEVRTRAALVSQARKGCNSRAKALRRAFSVFTVGIVFVIGYGTLLAVYLSR